MKPNGWTKAGLAVLTVCVATLVWAHVAHAGFIDLLWWIRR